MTPEQLKTKLETSLSDATIVVVDLTGTHDHYSVKVVSPQFEGMLPIKRHRMINDLLRDELKSGEIHALQLTTLTPSEA